MDKKKKLVLVADDQSMNLKLFSMILDKLGYESVYAEDGAEAFENVKKREPDLIFMDILMPKMDGHEASKNIRNLGYKKPIIAVTASDLLDEHKNCIDSGMNDMLKKPIKISEVEKMLQKWIDSEEPNKKDSALGSHAIVNTVFDSNRMLDSFMNDEKAALSLLARFIERTRLQLEKLPALKDSGDWESARRDAHSIRGAAFTMGAAKLGNEAARLEQAYKTGSNEEADIIFPEVLDTFLCFKKEAEEYIQSKN